MEAFQRKSILETNAWHPKPDQDNALEQICTRTAEKENKQGVAISNPKSNLNLIEMLR